LWVACEFGRHEEFDNRILNTRGLQFRFMIMVVVQSLTLTTKTEFESLHSVRPLGGCNDIIYLT
jgi:hypothetical protein